METSLFGVNLFTECYAECVAFYRDLVGLSVYRSSVGLTGFVINDDTYLMVERGGVGSESAKTRAENPFVLRWDVPDLEKSLEENGARFLSRRQGFSWGVIAVLVDPDGNRVEIGELGPTSLGAGG